MVIHDTLDVAVHLHPPATSTVAVFFDWPGGTCSVPGETLTVHGAPAWVMTYDCPATVSVVDR